MKAEKSTFPLNAWYAAAYDVELGRRLNGSVSALEDACWHRLMPLSLRHLDGLIAKEAPAKPVIPIRLIA